MAASGSSDRSFGIVFAVFFALVGIWPLYEGEVIRIWAIVVSVVFLLAAFIRPGVLAPLNRLWTKFGLLLHKFTNPIILGLIFFAVLTPFALATRVFGRDVLRLKLDPNLSTYWMEHVPSGPDSQSMKNQF